MKQAQIDQLESNYKFDGEGLELAILLADKYGQCHLSNYLLCSSLNDASVMDKIKDEMDDDFLLICHGNTSLHEALKLNILFTNIDCIYGEDFIINKLMDNDFINIYHEYELMNNYRKVTRTIVFKGFKWNKCPRIIKQHFDEYFI